MTPFRDLPLSALLKSELIHACPVRSYAKNEVIFFKEDESNDIFFVLNGSAKAMAFSSDGKPIFFIAYEPGDIFGYYAAFTKKPRTASLIAKEDLTTAIIPASQFLSFLAKDLKRSEEMMNYMASHLRFNSLRQSCSAHLAAPVRVAAFLAFLAEETNSRTLIIDNREDFASQLNVTRETLSRVLNKFQEDDIIELASQQIKIMNMSALYEIFL